MRTTPTAVDLLDVVAALLQEESTRSDRFEFRVAATALAIVRRELQLGAAADSATQKRLSQILNDKEHSAVELERKLAELIAAGRITISTPGIMEYLWESTLAELSIDQPTYATYKKETSACDRIATSETSPIHE